MEKVQSQTSKNKRINISLPIETVRLMDRVARNGERSQFIDEAVRYYVSETARKHLREMIKEGAQVNASRDLILCEDWFPLEEEAYPPNPK